MGAHKRGLKITPEWIGIGRRELRRRRRQCRFREDGEAHVRHPSRSHLGPREHRSWTEPDAVQCPWGMHREVVHITGETLVLLTNVLELRDER